MGNVVFFDSFVHLCLFIFVSENLCKFVADVCFVFVRFQRAS